MSIKCSYNYFTLESNGTTILKGMISNNLMQVNYSSPNALTTLSSPSLWHSRLRHPGSAPLKSMGLPPLHLTWQVCQLNKATLLPYETQPEESAVVDETHSEETAAPYSNDSPTPAAEQSSKSALNQAPRCIKVIRPRHPTLINSEIDSCNILTFSRRPRIFLKTSEDSS
ncbi:hypothetical protein O181_064129 [Austropuccinia psidii MF-1]|uniref:GAG-pre-integrase domain-containing protein n=1 Tax=Austropuccinia psidii MF-1 TaxID=1389203 RepID=A0A9Q3ENG6_9BASI|nr:hypothetical protein [Austropuccinia psidii MF-1]